MTEQTAPIDRTESAEGFRMNPADWDSFRSDLHGLLDACIDHLAGVRNHRWHAVRNSSRSRSAWTGHPAWT